MKKYRICLFLFLGVSVLCILTAFLVRRRMEYPDREQGTEMENTEAPETVTEDQMAANQSHVQARASEPEREEYYLVAEDGVLLVFLKDRKTICLYTHVPLMDFPAGERLRLREGIWFSSMAEVLNYLESYTS